MQKETKHVELNYEIFTKHTHTERTHVACLKLNERRRRRRRSSVEKHIHMRTFHSIFDVLLHNIASKRHYLC